MRHAFPTLAALALLGLMLPAGTARAAEPTGQDLYKAHCKVCHAAGSPHGEYTPMSLIQEQWETFFKKKYEAKHQGLDHPGLAGKKVLEVVSPDLLVKIRKFAIDHAADSEQPMTCGK